MKPIEESWDSCVKCGICRSVCPVFKEKKEEPFVARGHITLIQELIKGNVDFSSKKAKKYLGECLLCTTCVESCPNNAHTDLAVVAARTTVNKIHGIPLYKRVMAKTMSSRKLLDLSVRLGNIFSSVIFKTVQDVPRQGINVKIKNPVVEKDRLLLPISKKTFLNTYPDIIKGSSSKKVAVFIGCAVNYAYTEVGDALVDILERLGIEIVIPKAQACCGGPIYYSGMVDTAEKLAKKNIKLFEKIEADAILIPEPTCAAAIKVEYPRIFKYFSNDEYLERAQKLSERIRDPADYFYNDTNLIDILKNTRLNREYTVTYHDSCHLNRSLGVKTEPRELMKAIGNLEFVEMKDADRCCGNGGTFSVDFRETSLKIGRRKAQNIINSGADIVVTGCSGCMMQIAEVLNIEHSKVSVKHTIEIIDKALKGSDL